MSTVASPSGPAVSEAGWPAAGEADVVVLAFASTPTEQRVLHEWLQRNRPDGAAVRMLDGRDPALEAELTAAGADPPVAPIRVAWLPRERGGRRATRTRDLLAFRNPRRPSARAQERILRSEPDRCRVVVAEPARASELRARLESGNGDAGFGEFVRRQAVLALDRAERNVIGTQYKVPRFVSEEICESGNFREAVSRLAERLETPEAEVGREAASCIDEMVASQSELAIDAWGSFGRWLSRAYTVEVDDARVKELHELNAKQALVFLPSHRSYLDPLVLRAALHETNFPPNHVLGGINVAFWPIGPVARRSGYVFIRRSFRDNPVYKFALREYMAYLMRKRFNLEWYIEGGRSRTGKLRPPRYGLLGYLVDAFRHGGIEDVSLVPVSIVYDQLYEVEAMAAEEHGAQKTAESLGWLVGYARAQGRGFGTARVSFGEPLSLRGALASRNGAEPASDPKHAVEKVAFEVCHRIGRVTPITPTAMLALALLGVEDRALTLTRVRSTLDPLLDYVEARRLPTAGALDLRSEDGVLGALGALQRNGVVECFDKGPEPVWAIGPDRHLEAAFYRNAAIHFFVNRAIAELVLARASEEDGPRVFDEAWNEALRLRDLLKFEFFFRRKRDFAVRIREEMAIFDPGWEDRPHDPGDAWRVLADSRMHVAHRVLRPFLEAYDVAAERLAARDPAGEIDQKEFLAECLGAAQQYRLQRRLYSPESVSKEMLGNALKLARNRGLLEPGGPEVAEGRRAFAEEIRAEVCRVGRVRDLALRDLEAEDLARA